MQLFNTDFHLLRPEWLFMLIPVLILAWLFWSKKLFSRDWESVIDARLLPHLLIGQSGRKSIWPLLFWLSLAMIVIFTLSGPVWKKLPLPVFKQQSALVIILDLSRSMNTADIKPSRLVRARLKLLDLLKQRKEGQTALVVFAATAYTVSPLTDDTETIQSLVSSLTTDLMPVQGSRVDLALTKALELFENAGIHKGDILLMSDGVNAKSIKKLESLKLQNYRVSVLAVGTPEGAPIPLPSGGFVKDSQGSIVIAKTDQAKLHALSSGYGGVFQAMSLTDADLERMQKLFNDNKISKKHEQTDFKADRWREEGPWILLLLTPLVALAFRRGIFLSVLLAFIILPMPKPVLALELPKLPGWGSLWQNTNQRAEESLKQGDAEKAAELFDRADWKAASYYKSGQYEQALEQLNTVKTTEGAYNQGNTLAKMGRLQEALESYDDVLKQQPEHEDALFNRKLVEDELKKQQQNQQNQDGEKNNQEQNDQQKSDQENKDQQQQDQQNSQQQSDQQNQQQQSNKDNESEKNDDKEKDQQELEQQAKQDEKEKAEEEKKAAQEEAEKQQADEKQKDAKNNVSEQETESLTEQAEAQWLRRIPDDPGGLLRNKFKYQYGRQQQPAQEQESW